VPGLLALGDASYSIYLSHILLLGVARFIWIRAGLEAPTLAHALGFVALAAVIVVAGSLLVYNGIERPITKGLQHLYRRTRQVAASPAQR
jgi:exopolysaccharide production protein ExoZ